MPGLTTNRKRARSEDGDNDGSATKTDDATGAKRQRLDNNSEAENVPPSITVDGESIDTLVAAAPAVGRFAGLATTPKTPRTVHAVASAITGAIAYGVGNLGLGGRARGKSLSGQASSLQNGAHGVVVDGAVDEDMDAEGELEFDDLPSTPTSKKSKLVPQVPDNDKEDNATLVGSVSPTPDGSLKAPAEAAPAEAAPAEAEPAAEPAADAPKRRGRKPAAPKDPSKPSTPRKTPARKKATPKAAATNADGTVKRGRGRPRKQPIVEEDPVLKLAQANLAKQLLLQQQQQQQLQQQQDAVEGDEVCLICGKPDSEPPNEIILCDTCDLAVHQQCYNVPVIPEGDWFCKNCVRKQEQEQQEKQEKQQQTGKTPDGDETEEDAATDQQASRHASELPTAAVASSTTPARDLAPDIADFERHLQRTKRILLGRCTGRQRVRLHGQDDAYDKVYQVVEQTVVAGEGNSMMVIGARGTGKTAMVETILEDLAGEHGGAFHVVRLNGFIHTDDKLALREIWRQLGKEMLVDDDVVSKTNNYADTLASLLALLSHPSEIQAAAVGTGTGPGSDSETAASAPAVTSTAVVFIMDEFDMFATHARQTLLYNLFDIAQARKAPIAVLGLTTKIDVVESLEKRVKSRFSHRYVYLSLPRTLPAYWDICRAGLVIDAARESKNAVVAVDVVQEKGYVEFQQWWKHMIDTAKDDATFQEQLEFHFYSNKSVAAFWTTCLMPLAAVSSAAPRLRLPPVGCNMAAPTTDVVRTAGRPSLAAAVAAATAVTAQASKAFDDVTPLPLTAPDSKLHLLASLSELELSLLIAAARLDIVLSTDTVNFAMAYDEYVSLMGKQRVQSSLASSGIVGIGGTGSFGNGGGGGGLVIGGGARVWGRGVASRAWERLAALGLLIPAGMGGNGRGRPGALVTSGLEGRSMWRSEVALEEIPAAPGVRLGPMLARWCKEI